MALLKVVIARYRENIDWVENLKFPYLIYNKGSDYIAESIKIPEIGREVFSYLNHIIRNYDTLDDFTAFVQGKPEDHCSGILNIINSFNPKDYPGDMSMITLCNHTLIEPIPPFGCVRDIFNIFFDDLRYHHSIFPAGQQFIVKKENIQLRPFERYVEAYNYCFKNKYNGEFSAAMERIWYMLFDNNIPNKA